LPLQRVWRSTLGNIVNDIRGEDANRSSVSPAVFVVGATASLDLLSQDSQL
jgi:siroheme synthase